jgi:dipeptidyl aminopeptidase/acylaminoacyl peptidase
MDLSTRKVEIITGDIDWDVEGWELSDDAARAAFTVNEGGIDRLYLLDPRSRRYAPVDRVPAGLVYGLRFSPDGRRLALTLNSSRSPSDVFTLELGEDPLTTTGITRWTRSEVGGLDTDGFVEPQLVEFPTFDGRRIPAFVYLPDGPGPHPVVVSIHGGPEGQYRPGFSSTFQMWIAELGVAVVAPNVRGSAGYGKSYVKLDNGFKREDSVKDIGALLDWIAAQPDLDAGRVAVYGGSYGGYMVLASLVHYSDRLAGGVDIVGVSNFVTFLENTQDYRRDLRRVEYGDERNPEMRAFLSRIAPSNNAERIRAPLFVAQGQNDPRVPATESQQIVAAVRAAGHDVWYMKALDEGHGFRKKENRDLYDQIVVMFLREHLVGAPKSH